MDFLGSEFIQEYELPWIKQRVDAGELGLIPILVAPVLQNRLGWLADRQMLPGPPTPLLRFVDKEAEWKDVRNRVLEGIENSIDSLRQARTAKPSGEQNSAQAGAAMLAPVSTVGEAGDAPSKTVAVDKPNSRHPELTPPAEKPIVPEKVRDRESTQTIARSPGTGSTSAGVAAASSETWAADKVSSRPQAPVLLAARPTVENKGQDVKHELAATTQSLATIVAPPLQPFEIRAAVEKAITEIEIKRIRTGYTSSVRSDVNALPVWRHLYGSYRGDAIQVLCELAMDAQSDSDVYWKAIKLLTFGIRVPEGRELATRIVDAVSVHMATWGDLRDLALQLFDEAPLLKKEKWERLLALLPTIRPDAYEPIAKRLVGFTAAEDRETAANAILAALKTCTGGPSFVDTLESLDCRSMTPKLRELLFVVPPHLAAGLAILLAKWEDSASAPNIRELIQYQGERLHDLPDVLLSLYELDGGASAECIADCIRFTSPLYKKLVLDRWNREPKSRVAVRAAREPALATLLDELIRDVDDVKIKDLAVSLRTKTQQQTSLASQSDQRGMGQEPRPAAAVPATACPPAATGVPTPADTSSSGPARSETPPADLLVTRSSVISSSSASAGDMTGREPDATAKVRKMVVMEPHGNRLPLEVITNSIGMKMVRIPAGEFLMGSPDSDRDASSREKPQHLVRITKSFYVGLHPITVGQFRHFVCETGYKTEGERAGDKVLWCQEDENRPVGWVSWRDAIEFCEWLGQYEQNMYRLPTEAEWEYAIRAGTQETRLYARCDGKSFVKTHAIGQILSNSWGLLFVVQKGKGCEWCADCFSEEYYRESSIEDPSGPKCDSSSQSRVLRGSGYVDYPDHAYFRCTFRAPAHPNSRDPRFGFRVVGL
jgi:formylglycine-generating enzyme required for sulfatase activity